MHCSGHYGLIKFSNTNWNLALPWQPPTILFQPPFGPLFSPTPPGAIGCFIRSQPHSRASAVYLHTLVLCSFSLHFVSPGLKDLQAASWPCRPPPLHPLGGRLCFAFVGFLIGTNAFLISAGTFPSTSISSSRWRSFLDIPHFVLSPICHCIFPAHFPCTFSHRPEGFEGDVGTETGTEMSTPTHTSAAGHLQ